MQLLHLHSAKNLTSKFIFAVLNPLHGITICCRGRAFLGEVFDNATANEWVTAAPSDTI
jgi:hypothetical protein